MHTNYNWSQVWRNLYTARIPDAVRSTLYMVFQDILPTKERFNRLPSLLVTDAPSADRHPAPPHNRMWRRWEMWRWTRVRLTRILRINACHIPSHWSLRPQLNLWSRQRRGAVYGFWPSSTLCVVGAPFIFSPSAPRLPAGWLGTGRSVTQLSASYDGLERGMDF